MIKKGEKMRTIILGLVVMLLWGSLFPIIKLEYTEFSINTAFVPNLLFFAGVRFSLCGFLILLTMFVKGKRIPTVKSKGEWIGLIAVGLFAVVFHYACTYVGLSVVESSKTALLKQSGVLVFVCFSFLFIKDDKFTVGKIIGAVFGIVSIVALDFDSVGFSFGFGEILIILASLCTVSSNVVCKKMLDKTNALTVTGYTEFLGGIILLIVGAILGGGLYHCSLKGGLLFTYIIIATVISYGLWYSEVKNTDLSKLFIIKLSEPLFTAIIGALILSENVLTWQYLVSFVSVGLALFVSNVNIESHKKIETKSVLTDESIKKGA